MNNQFTPRTGSRGIQWTDYTANPVGGCMHRCRWKMPDGQIAICYAEDIANRFAQRAYPHGFEHHYWRPGELKQPGRVKEPSFFFIDSMSDLFGATVPDEQVVRVLDMARRNPQHTFQSLTKAPGRLLKFIDLFPPNLWVGVSSPPDFMMGNALDGRQQRRMLEKTLDVLRVVGEKVPVVWMSLEPVSWDMAHLMRDHPLKWAVIGAATNGRQKHQPEHVHVQNLLDLFDETKTPVFFKGNLDWPSWREDFPVIEGWDQAVRRRQDEAREHGWPLNRFLDGVPAGPPEAIPAGRRQPILLIVEMHGGR